MRKWPKLVHFTNRDKWFWDAVWSLLRKTAHPDKWLEKKDPEPPKKAK